MKYKYAKLILLSLIVFLFGLFLRIIGLENIKFWQAYLLFLWSAIPITIVFSLLEKQAGIDENDIIE